MNCQFFANYSSQLSLYGYKLSLNAVLSDIGFQSSNSVSWSFSPRMWSRVYFLYKINSLFKKYAFTFRSIIVLWFLQGPKTSVSGLETLASFSYYNSHSGRYFAYSKYCFSLTLNTFSVTLRCWKKQFGYIVFRCVAFLQIWVSSDCTCRMVSW